MRRDLTKSVLARNRRANFDYDISKQFTAGIMLSGAEVKSVRAGQIQFRDSFVRIEKGEAWLVNAYIAPYRFAHLAGYDPSRRRKLLLKKPELRELSVAVSAKKLATVPLRVFLSGGRIKIEVGIGKGRRKFDKRAKIKERESKRQVRAELAEV